jgi:hypothetical protein
MSSWPLRDSTVVSSPVWTRRSRGELVARPQGPCDESLFEVAETPIRTPAEGQVLIRNAYFSVDPYMRPRMKRSLVRRAVHARRGDDGRRGQGGSQRRETRATQKATGVALARLA